MLEATIRQPRKFSAKMVDVFDEVKQSKCVIVKITCRSVGWLAALLNHTSILGTLKAVNCSSFFVDESNLVIQKMALTACHKLGN